MKLLLSPDIVATGLDPVVHAKHGRPFGGMDRRIKSAGDESSGWIRSVSKEPHR